MPADTYSNYLGAILQGTGNNNNNWGTLANSAFTLFDKSIAGKSARTVTGGTLDLDNTTPPAGEHGLPEMVVYLTGTLLSDQIILVPNTPKVWLVYNGTSGAYTVKFKTAAGSASSSIPQGGWQWVCSTGNDFFALVGPATDITGVNFKALPTVNGSALVPVGASVEYEGIFEPTGWLFKYGQNVSRTTYALLFEAITTTTTATKNGTTTLSSVGVDYRNKGLVGWFVEGTGINVGTYITAIAATTITLSAAASGSGSITIRLLPYYGQGDGSTTFTIPDDRNRVAVGRGDMGGTDAGRIVASSDFPAPNSIGSSGGSSTHVLTSAQIPAHSHTASQAAHTHTGTAASHIHKAVDFSLLVSSSNSSAAGATQTVGGAVSTDLGTANTTASGALAVSLDSPAPAITVNNSTGGGGAFNVIQPSIVKNKIIFTGVV